ncbi:hypothetical protein CLV98_10252 [Dyadobacter jejuensis]|uniref:Tetratricopeptide repeat protein n=1 Tax=Dyadobacter jejuensis TaxID=1082580 RepID=A0A316AR03_9BACT|nr:hypothetical protein [Dyadobacter jejuensis]PWJ59220.1 hypothetical protein CLV98_10252 [Dyadobacter jejuensis]
MSIVEKEMFGDLVSNPSKLDQHIIPHLEDTVDRFPFCQIGYSLLAKATASTQSESFSKYKPRAAAYALSRVALQQLVENSEERLADPIQERAIEHALLLDTEVVVPEPFALEEESLEKPITDEQKKQKQIIEGFMRKNPRIARQENDLEPVSLDLNGRLAHRGGSSIDTEAFAKILINQGKIDKAKDVYQKLILKNPEKRNYFAKKLGELNRLA